MTKVGQYYTFFDLSLVLIFFGMHVRSRLATSLSTTAAVLNVINRSLSDFFMLFRHSRIFHHSLARSFRIFRGIISVNFILDSVH
jgi:hypothetical protein